MTDLYQQFGDMDSDIFDGLTAETIPDASFVEPELPDGDSPAEPEYDSPATDLVAKKARSLKGKQYEKKVKTVLAAAFRISAAHPATVPDAAAILMYGPRLASTAGDLAAEENWAAGVIDFFTEGAENTKLAAVSALAIFALQVVRNHEPVLEPNPNRAGIRIPFTKNRRIKIKWGIKLGRVRELTHDPVSLSDYVFENPKVIAALEKQGINVPSSKTRKDRR